MVKSRTRARRLTDVWKDRRSRALLILLTFVVSTFGIGTGYALTSGNLSLNSLGGFGIEGNMVLNGSETYDWVNAGGSNAVNTCTNLGSGTYAGPLGTLNLFCANDKAAGGSDNSLNGKEQDTSLQAVCGSIPQQKSDLNNFYVASQSVSGASGIPHSILYLGWTRANTLGSADMDFEFNQLGQDSNLALSSCPSGNGATITPNRSANDLLISYEFGGNDIAIKVSKWITSNTNGPCATSQSAPCWGQQTELTSANEANGAINDGSTPTSTTCVTPNGKTVSGCVGNALSGGTLQPETFGEAGVDLTAVLGSSCTTFGSAYLKSRSSAVFTDALKDYIAPISVNVTNCVTPTITTTLSTGSAALGSSVTDSATISNFAGGNPPGGRVAFNVYSGTGNLACTGNPLETLPAGASTDGTNGLAWTAALNSTATAGPVTVTSGTTLSPGDYEVQAVYTGDGGGNLASHSACGTEHVTITKRQPGFSTQDSPVTNLTVGTPYTISDTATMSGLVGGVTPGGTMTFTLYSDATCTTSTGVTATVNVTGASVPSGNQAFTPTSVGSPAYYWGVSYSGDGNYLGVPKQCGGANETYNVVKASPSLTSQMQLNDKVTISGGDNPTGTVTFALFDNNTCSGAAVATWSAITLVNGTASTAGVAPATGSNWVVSGKTYSWRAVYSGDSHNNGFTLGCSATNHEEATISYV